MSEEYCGVKFRTIFRNKTVPKDKRVSQLIHWCNEFNRMGFTPGSQGSAGNLSFRTDKGFIISCSRADFSDVSESDFVEVVGIDIDLKVVQVDGVKGPSSESFMHGRIYSKRKDVNAVFHGHSDDFLKWKEELDLPITKKEEPAGTIELMNEVVKVLGTNNFILIKNHGFLSLSDSMDCAGNITMEKFSQLRKIAK
ncbi:MAG: class II aldolase/adducin family protein [Nanoarchaeota archaeon]|nr:class II aldolase/adducin family protein [Nanoarchaeota archaeon]